MTTSRITAATVHFGQGNITKYSLAEIAPFESDLTVELIYVSERNDLVVRLSGEEQQKELTFYGLPFVTTRESA